MTIKQLLYKTKVKMTINFSRKILKQMEKRGWTKESVIEVFQNPSRTVKTVDRRYNLDETRNNEPATVYYRSDKAYIICNDLNGDIVQVSDFNDPDWIDPLAT